MLRPIALVLAAALVGTASADPLGEGRAHAEAFARACVAGDVTAALALYADDAIVIWPGQGQEGKGRAAIEKLLPALCVKGGDARLALETIEAIPLGDAHLVTIGQWKVTQPVPGGGVTTTQVRTTEVLVKQDGAWRYLVDHASVGAPPAPPRGGERRGRRRAR